MRAAFQVLSLSFALLAVGHRAEAIEVEGVFHLEGTCYCGQFGGQECGYLSPDQRELSVFVNSPLNQIPYTDRELLKPEDAINKGAPSHFAVYYSDPERTQKFKVLSREDQLEYRLDLRGSDLTIAVRNLTRPQPDLLLKLAVPEDQEGGKIGAPAQIQTLNSSTRLEYSSYKVDRTANSGGLMEPNDSPKFNTTYLLENWRIEKRGDRVIVTQSYDYKIQPDPSAYTLWLPAPIRRFSSGIYTCELVRKAASVSH